MSFVCFSPCHFEKAFPGLPVNHQLGDDQAMLSISDAYRGRWSSRFHQITLRYNERVWSLVETVDTVEDTLVGLMDESDGSSFLLRVEYVEAAEQFDDWAYIHALSEGIRMAGQPIERDRKHASMIAGHRFTCVDYHFENARFGWQLLRHAFLKQGNYVLVLSLAWPQGPEANGACPLKLRLLLEGLTVTALSAGNSD